MPASPSRRPRLLLTGLVLACTATLGVLAAALVPGARADGGLPLPSTTAPLSAGTPSASPPPVSVPSLPLPLPLTTPTLPVLGETTTTTTPAGSDDPPSDSSTGTSLSTSGARGPEGSSVSTGAAQPAGAVRLRNGRVSIPAANVGRLAIRDIRVLPTVVRTSPQTLVARLRLVDTRGYVVRGALVAVRSVPAGRIRVASAHSRIDGTVAVSLRTTARLPLRPGVLTLLFAGYRTAKPSGPAASQAVVRVPVRVAR